MSKDSKRTKKATVSEDSKLRKKGSTSGDSKLAVKTAAPKNSNPTEKSDNKPADKSAASRESKLTEETTVANDVKPIEKGGQTPVFDFTELMSQFPLPGVDFATLVDREQKNILAKNPASELDPRLRALFAMFTLSCCKTFRKFAEGPRGDLILGP